MGSNAPSCDRRQRPFGPRGACALVQTACSCRAGRNCVRTFRGFPGARLVCMVDSHHTTPGRRSGPGDMTKSRRRRFCDARSRSNVLATPGVAAPGSSGGPIRREKAGSRRDSVGTCCAFRLHVKSIEAITAGRVLHRAATLGRVFDRPVFMPMSFGVKETSSATRDVPGVVANTSTRQSRCCLFSAYSTAVGHLPSPEYLPPPCQCIQT